MVDGFARVFGHTERTVFKQRVDMLNGKYAMNLIKKNKHSTMRKASEKSTWNEKAEQQWPQQK